MSGGGRISCVGSTSIGSILIEASSQEIGLMHSRILIDGKRVIDEASLSTSLSSYVSKTDIVPSQMIQGYAENAYKATMAVMDGNGVEIATDYAKKTDLTAKQDVLPYNQYTGLYDISAWGAAQAAYVPWTGVEDKPAAVVLSGTYEDETTFTFNLQGA